MTCRKVRAVDLGLLHSPTHVGCYVSFAKRQWFEIGPGGKIPILGLVLVRISF